MILALTAIIALSTLAFTVILTWLGTFNFATLAVLIVLFNFGQWLFAPYLIDAVYRVREIPKSENPKLYEAVERLSQKSGIKTPKLMLARIPLPNAFAYGSPIAGTRVAVTEGLLKTLDSGEVEAVIGHELGHLKHRDVQIMMFVSILPALFYYIGYSMMWSSMFSRREDQGGASAALIGMACIAIYWILQMFTLYLSRIREYYADRHSATIVEDGPEKLSEGLAKIVYASRRLKKIAPQTTMLNAFKCLFISDPDKAEIDTAQLSQAVVTSDRRLVEEILERKITTFDKIMELFSTHPNIVKRIKALRQLAA